ncbi:MAG TPA: VTT domain-containing protein, partial [Thermoanaerobaculia bacterium]|nr:VTT domain-containing protein [Thermoanaerobaculia bacterium]
MSRRALIKIAIAVLLAGAVAAIYFTPLREHLTRDHIRHTVEQLRGVWYGPIAFIVLYAIGCVLAIPASVFILAAGVIWGWKLGGTYALIGGVLGATLSFFTGRFIGEGLLERFGRVGKMVAKQVDHAGFKSLLVLRLIPLFPFAVLNYGAGVAGVTLLDFIFATTLGLAPSNYVFAYCADALFNGTMTEGDALKRLFTVAALMLALVLIPMGLKRMLKMRVPEPEA